MFINVYIAKFVKTKFSKFSKTVNFWSFLTKIRPYSTSWYTKTIIHIKILHILPWRTYPTLSLSLYEEGQLSNRVDDIAAQRSWKNSAKISSSKLEHSSTLLTCYTSMWTIIVIHTQATINRRIFISGIENNMHVWCCYVIILKLLTCPHSNGNRYSCTNFVKCINILHLHALSAWLWT